MPAARFAPLSGRESAVILIRKHFFLGLGFAGAFSLASAAVREVDLVVEGMKCPLCARGIRESLVRLPGVGSVEADLESGRVKIAAMPGHSLDFQGIRTRVERWGFQIVPEPVIVRAVGTIQHGPRDRLMFHVLGNDQEFDLLEGEELRRLLSKLPPSGAPRVALTARLHAQPEHLPATLSVLSYEVSPR
ncbi:MAG TPA: heavy metal-associated domain-containing protein [Candidatus Polarisedimenticolia bacterium]|jgi:copper chaperone CopZ|nr:heavy metal-associated domain-containing protein [Candidatus Polarisedimenticolia bacterium]